jgi:serine/threonine-protein kinase HipA
VSQSEVQPMKSATVHQQGVMAGHLRSTPEGAWEFQYLTGYQGAPVSLTMPVRPQPWLFPGFPPPFEGLLPEGPQLEALLRRYKIDRHDAFRQLVTVGRDVVGALTIEEESPAVS